MRRTLKRKGKVLVEVFPRGATEWFRQDIDLTVAFVDADGKELGKQTWKSLTIGNDAEAGLVFGSRTKSPTLEIEMTEEELQRVFARREL